MVSQPKGGYVPKKLFVERYYHDKTKNNTIEDKHIYNIESAFTGIQGMAVDYITRYILSGDKEMAFDIPIKGAKCVDKVYENDYEYNKIMQLLDNVKGTDDVSVYNVCKIVGYDVAFRRGVSKFRNVDDILPTKELVYNIQVMVQRCIEFIDNNGPLVLSDFTADNVSQESYSDNKQQYNQIIYFVRPYFIHTCREQRTVDLLHHGIANILRISICQCHTHCINHFFHKIVSLLVYSLIS